MSDRLPPLTALRAFEAAARHLSFARAADELNVTPAALSFQIKSLETHLGTPLFNRLNRAVELTEAGRAMSPGMSEGFQTLARSWNIAKRLTNNAALNVTAGPAFTSKWLAPRLYEFAIAHPEIELRFAATLKMLDFTRDDVDVAIRFGQGDDRGLHVTLLPDEWVMPVMTPALAARFDTIDALKEAPFIFDDSISFLKLLPDWEAWFTAVGSPFAPDHGLRFSQADHAVDAALNGVGVVMGRRSMVVKDLAEGRLVAPFQTAIMSTARYRFLCLPGTEDRPQIVAFREWMLENISAHLHITERLNIIPIEDIARK